MRDLPPRRRDELAHDPRSRVLLRERQGVERSADMLADDGARAADRAERRETQLARPLLPLALPEPFEHELEVRRLDAGLRRRLVEHRLDERILGRERLPDQLAVARERAEDRRRGPPRGRAGRAAAGSRTARGSGRRTSSSSARASSRSASRTLTRRPGRRRSSGSAVAQWPFDAVVEDVLLELVEQQMQLAALLGGRGDRVDEPGRGAELTALGVHRGDQARRRILRPRARARPPARRSSSRSRRATPARRSELLPTPLGP